MEFSFEQPRPRPQAAGAVENNEQAIGSDRLRKAIERNRAKQAKRTRPSDSGANSTSRLQADSASKEWSLPGQRAASSASTVNASTRRSVGRAGEQEFTTELRKRTPRAPSPVAYSQPPVSATTAPVPARSKKMTTVKTLGTKGKSKRTSKIKKSQTNEYIVKGVWVFCALLLVRLVFSTGGVIDFYDKRDILNDRFDEKDRIELENIALIKEIELLKKNAHYQKKVVRDHLGYIAADEFLILFPES